MLGLLLWSGCYATIVSGPTEVQTGDIVTYVVEVGSYWGPGGQFVLAADVPQGWTLVDSRFSGTIQGNPVSGQGHLLNGSGACGNGLIRPGFQRIRLSGEPLPEAFESDTGTVTLRFAVSSQPEGEYRIGFRFGGWHSTSGTCSAFAVRTINRTPGPLRFLQAHFDDRDGVDGLFGASGLDVSPQGDLVLVVGTHDDVIALFSRDADGSLTFLKTVPGPNTKSGEEGLFVILDDVTFGPAGHYVYRVRREEEELLVYAREPTGLQLVQTVTSTEIPDLEDLVDFVIFQQHAYALANGIDVTGFDGKRLVVFDRDPETGELAFLTTVPAAELQWVYADAKDLAISADGSQIYASFVDPTFGFLSVLSRDASSGIPSHHQTLSYGDDAPASVLEIRNVVSSPDDGLVFTAGGPVLSVYQRGPEDDLSWLQDYSLPQLGFGYLGASRLDVGNGDLLWVAGRGWIALFRFSAAGELSLLDLEFDADPPNLGIDNNIAITTSPDGRHLYTADLVASAVAAFDSGRGIFTDGFESGDLSAWTAVVD